MAQLKELDPELRVPQNAVMTMASYIFEHTVMPPDIAVGNVTVEHSLDRLHAFNQSNGIHPSRPQLVRLLVLAAKDAREACDAEGVLIKIPPQFRELDEGVWEQIAPYFETRN